MMVVIDRKAYWEGVYSTSSTLSTPELREEISGRLRSLAWDNHGWLITWDGKDICLDCQRPWRQRLLLPGYRPGAEYVPPVWAGPESRCQRP
jgi:hypothetical protein